MKARMGASLFKQLTIPPSSSDLYLWCDYVEVRCLTHPDKRFSRQNLIECLAELDGFSMRSGNEFDASDDEADETSLADDLDGGEGQLDGVADEDEDDEDPIPKSDRRESKVSSIFAQLGVRSSIFASSYPFTLDAGLQEICLAEPNTGGHGLYLQLLLSASLRLIEKSRRAELTEEFEVISEKIFRGLMPAGWEVHQFGAKAAVRYRGHLFTRLSKLADDWRGHLRIKRAHLKTTNSGDGGLDLVAWHPLGSDGREGIPIAAAQCGCTAEEWSLKQLEASPSKLSIDVLHRWATYYFMPQDLVGVIDGQLDWQRRNDVARAIVIDRLRIVRLAREFDADQTYVNLTPVVQEAKSYAVP
ncbi:hypothetical protein EIQ27_19895 [Xanthomonas campestris pv. armoraciae]